TAVRRDRLEALVRDHVTVARHRPGLQTRCGVAQVPVRTAVEDERVVAAGPAVDAAADRAVRTEDELVLVVRGADEVLEAAEARSADRARARAGDVPDAVGRGAMERVGAAPGGERGDVRERERRDTA